MKAIQVKYLGPTNHKGMRIKAIVEGGNSITLPRDYELSHSHDATRVAHELIVKLEWDVEITGSGVLPNGDYVFTIDRPTPIYEVNRDSEIV